MIKIKNQLNQFFFYTTIIAFFSILISCEKDPDQLGLGVLPGQDNFIVKTDTVTDIFANTIKLDSILSFYPDSAVGVLYKSIIGDYTDPLFGNTKASLLVNFFPDSTNHNFGTTPAADSLIFFLAYDSVMGDKNSDMVFKISELNKSLSYKEHYYSNLDDNIFKGRLLSETTIQFKDTLLRIKITDPEFISKLLNVPASAQANFINYQDYFKGFYLEALAAAGKGVLTYVTPWYYNSYSRLTLYYKNDATTGKDSINYSIVRRTVRTSKYTHNYTGTPVETVLQNTEISQKTTYVQGMSGLGTRIHIPSLSKWADEAPVAINKAELVIPVYQTSDIDSIVYPQRLSIMAISGTGGYSFIEYGFGQTFIGGVYNRKDKVYTFNLAKHLQKIANSKILGTMVENTDFIIIADGYKSNVTNSLSRVALDFSPGKGAKLNVIYSKQ